jgi:hypothetical protein
MQPQTVDEHRHAKITFRRKWVFVDARRSHHWLRRPDAPPGKQARWVHEKLTDPRAKELLEKMTKELTTGKLSGPLLVREFLKQCLAALQAHSRHLWDLQGWDDKLRLHPTALTDEELGKAMRVLLERDPGELSDGLTPLYSHADRAAVVAA